MIFYVYDKNILSDATRETSSRVFLSADSGWRAACNQTGEKCWCTHFVCKILLWVLNGTRSNTCKALLFLDSRNRTWAINAIHIQEVTGSKPVYPTSKKRRPCRALRVKWTQSNVHKINSPIVEYLLVMQAGIVFHAVSALFLAGCVQNCRSGYNHQWVAEPQQTSGVCIFVCIPIWECQRNFRP